MEKRAKTRIGRSERRDYLTRRRQKSRISNENDSSIFEQIRQVARRDARLELGEKKVRLFLTNWWCTHYKRPFKDELLQKYTLEELLYEYYFIQEVEQYREEIVKAEADRIEEEKYEEDLAWADEMEREEVAAKADSSKNSTETSKPDTQKPQEQEAYDPLKDPKQVAWMEEQIKQSKLVFGEDFGEDLKLDFEDGDE